MAAPINTRATTSLVGMREDLSDMIWNIDPYETPLMTATPKTKAKAVYTEWQTEALAAPTADNAHIEGDDSTAEARSPTVRVGNRTQIFKKVVQISRTADSVDKAGRATEMAHQIKNMTREIKRDMETSFFANQAQVTGTSTVAARLAGLGAWVTTNVNNVGGGGSNPTGNGTNARTDGGQTAFTQDDFDLTMQEVWLEGGIPDRVYLSAFQMDVALGFVGNNAQRANIDASKKTVINVMDIYMTPWGKVEFVPSRHVRSRDVWIIQTDMLAVATLDALRNEALAKTGDSEKRQLVSELTLCVKNEKALGLVADCSTT
jgi:hypothetical protein